jgi:hypothetical protein
MGEAKRRQPDREIRVAEAVERKFKVLLRFEELEKEAESRELAARVAAKEAIFQDKFLDKEYIEDILKAINRSNTNMRFELLAKISDSPTLYAHPAMAKYMETYERRMTTKRDSILPPIIGAGVISSGSLATRPQVLVDDIDSGIKVNVGTIGHVDHNRTTLMAGLLRAQVLSTDNKDEIK